MKYPYPITKLIEALKKLPGVGSKSAERYAFEMLRWGRSEMHLLASTIDAAAEGLSSCDTCGCLCDRNGCHFCDESRMAQGSLCVIASIRDAFTIEETREFKGSYHVLGALLSPIDGQGPESLGVHRLRERIIAGSIRELVIALDSTLEGDTTALYLKNILADLPIKISRLAFGIPMGSSLDYVDGSTLARAFSARSPY